MRPHKALKLEEPPQQVLVQFYNAEKEPLGPELDMPDSTSAEQLTDVLNSLQASEENFIFYLSGVQISSSLREACKEAVHSAELVIPITVHPQSLFRVSPATRATSCLQGHTESILSVQFSPSGHSLASGSGDTTVRLWDIFTETPFKTLQGHKNWVLVIAWSPDGTRLASAGSDGTIRIWNAETGNLLGKPLTGHRKWVTAVAWEPYHRNTDCRRMASSSKDSTIKVWDTAAFTCLFTLNGHSQAVTRVLWGGEGFLYSSSQDRLVKVWSDSGRLVRDLKGHGHWVNQLSLSTDFVLRTAYFDPFSEEELTPEQRLGKAHERYVQVQGRGERLVSCSDDFTLFLWNPQSPTSLARMTGHQQLVTQVAFSPDGHFVVSGSFDKSVKLWDGFSGDFLTTLRGHVGAVFQVVWSPDSRMIASASKDSTIKIWSVKSKKLLVDLPGHADQVYALDWSPDGGRLASGSRDRILSIWRN